MWLISETKTKREMLCHAHRWRTALERLTVLGEPFYHAADWPTILVSTHADFVKAKRSTGSLVVIMFAGNWIDGRWVDGDHIPATLFEGRRAPGA